jgi:predicted house-cleaning NTP pyrophosphatase (Maf/HAM1 superfamily)
VRISLKQLGRGATLFAATSLLMATTAVIPAEAAKKAGAACKKLNAKTKIGGDQYLCVKNPTVKKAKKTWVWIGCIDSNKL